VTIFLQQSSQCDYYVCSDLKLLHSIQLPEEVFIQDFLYFLQSSLDQLRPVVILSSEENLKQVDLGELKSFHFKIFPNQYIFLNFSIRNSLFKNIQSKDEILLSFTDIEKIISKILS
jgi:hypothetical protein